MLFLSIALNGQSGKTAIRSPKQVVEQYWTLETTGGRLTTEGWNHAARFFLRPSPVPEHRVIIVVGKDYSVWDPVIKDGTAEVIVGFRDTCKCNIDHELRLVPSKSYSAIKTSVRFKLVLTNKHWTFDSHGTPMREVEGTPQWRIDAYSTDSPTWLTIDAAIRYLTEAGNHATNPVFKQNANESLAKLMRLPR